jgi:oxygen-independent coproporphyrinogen-3 oxidase
LLGLYVHIPFCSAICNYCNFNRGLFDASLKARYVDALVSEIRASGHAFRVSNRPSPADTIYFGGGTPSLLEPDDVKRIVSACRESFAIASDCEITLEANPESVDEARLTAYRAAAVNRISYGVQSFRDAELRRLSRLHDAGRARSAVDEARRAGFENISLDLMMWLPGQRVSDWLESVAAAIEVAPEHLSLYLLEVYPNAPLKEEMARSQWSQAPDDDAAAMYLEAMASLDDAGYRQYEISNVARPARASRHNLKYWTDGEWLGFGCGAHSTSGGRRWKNVASTDEYVDRVQQRRDLRVDERRLSLEERVGEALFMGLRLTNGVSLDEVRARYGLDVWARWGRDLEPFLEDGCLKRVGERLWLTRRGMLLANEVMAVFV